MCMCIVHYLKKIFMRFLNLKVSMISRLRINFMHDPSELLGRLHAVCQTTAVLSSCIINVEGSG